MNRADDAPSASRAPVLIASLTAFVLLLLPAAPACGQADRPSQGGASADRPGPWTELTRGDLAAMRKTLLENHPGPVDPQNPAYREWLDHGYERALAMADSVESLDGMMAVLSFYTSGFHDGHLGWHPSFERAFSLWPGFVPALRQGRFVIDTVAPFAESDALREGAEILDCDGETLQHRLTQRVMAFREGIPSLEASRVRLAPEVLVDRLNPWLPRPKHCRVRPSPGSPPVDVSLSWRWIGREELQPLLSRAAYGPGVDHYAITHPADGVAWVTIPSFAENVGDHRAGLERLISGLPAERGDRLIVFDVRGNGGGNSAWGKRILAALFGEDYVERVDAATFAHVYTEWRASKGNAEFIERYTLPRFKKGSETSLYLEKLVAAMREGMATGRELVRVEDDSEAVEADTATVPANPLGEHVILLTDGWCASACLDFADLLLAIPGVRHAGAPTFADAVYIDNRANLLPSGIGSFGFSMKVYRHRPRGNNEPYRPDLRYPGDLWETGRLQAWLLRVAGD
jgi:hypothetical protein